MANEENIILNHDEIRHKTRRIAYQIYETFASESEVIIAGITGGGFTLAERIHETLIEISGLAVSLCEVKIDKKRPLDPIDTSLTPSEYTSRSVVLVDDVLNSGTTLMYGVKHFLEVPLKKFKTAVLVNRNHKKYPIKADFKGISLSTSSKEHVEVVLDGENDKAYLV